ncbi:hypothetical protein BH10PLA2_BH10PLA2_20800 [soil metagenome]
MAFHISQQMSTREKLIAVEQNANLELLNGELVERNVTVLAGLVEGHFLFQLGSDCAKTNAGVVFPASLGCRCFPDAPDDIREASVVVVRRDCYLDSLLRDEFLKICPDLIVEVISANSLASALVARLEAFKSIAVPLIWIVNPETRTIEINRPDGSVTRLHATDEITGESVLPGFRSRVDVFFPQ